MTRRADTESSAAELTRPLRIAVVGCGAISTLQHLPALARSPHLEAAVLIDRDADRARDAGRRFAVERVATSLAEARSTCELDAVLVATPNHLHASVTCEALESGLDVLVEKPMALDAAEAQNMCTLAAARQRVLAVGLEFRHAPGNRAVEEFLASGWLGTIERYELRQGVVPRWPFASDYVLRRETAGGGVLFDYGAHLLDLVFSWVGEPDGLRYRDDLRSPADGGVESNCEIEFEHASGLRGFLEISRTRNLDNRIRFFGERGILDVDVWSVDPVLRLQPANGRATLVGRNATSFDFGAAYDALWTDFAGAVRERRPPLVSGADGLRAQRWIERCYAERQPLLFPWDVADTADIADPAHVGGRAARP